MATQTQQLNVNGMSCEHCVRAVRHSVLAVAGVSTVDVSLEQKLATVAFDPEQTSLESIKAAIEAEGYSVG